MKRKQSYNSVRTSVVPQEAGRKREKVERRSEDLRASNFRVT